MSDYSIILICSILTFPSVQCLLRRRTSTSECECEQEPTMEQRIFSMLKELEEDDFNTLKWFLKKPEQVNGLKGIPKSQLEKATRYHTTDLIMQFYPGNEMDIMVDVLKSIDRHDLAEKFRKEGLSRPVQTQTEQTSELQTLPSPSSSTGSTGGTRSTKEEVLRAAYTQLLGGTGTILGGRKGGREGAQKGGKLGEKLGSSLTDIVVNFARMVDSDDSDE